MPKRSLLLLAAALAVLVGAFIFSRIHHRPPGTIATSSAPVIHAQAIASSSAAVVASQAEQATVTIDEVDDPSPDLAASPSSSGMSPARSPQSAPNHRRITITLIATQAIVVEASSSAAASASIPPDQFRDVTIMVPNHGRLGMIAGTMPGVVALDVELLMVDLPPWLMGAPLEVGLDIAGNLDAGAVGVSLGGKTYAIAGGWSQWDGRSRGVLLGIGLRF